MKKLFSSLTVYVFLGFHSALAVPSPEQKALLKRAPNASAIDYEAYLNTHPTYEAPIDRYLRNHPQTENKAELEQLLNRAQNEFLTGSIEAAKVTFIKIADLRWADDWDIVSRKTIFYSLMRLAHLATGEFERQRWLKAAIIFAPNLKPDAELFAPPLVSSYRSTLLSLPTQSLSGLNLPPSTEEVLINGAKTSEWQSGSWPLGKLRVTVLSNFNEPASKIIQWNGTANPFQSISDEGVGSCEDYQELRPGSEVLFFSRTCIRSTEKLSPHQLAQSPAPMPERMPTPQYQLKTFLKNKWPWLAVVGAGLAIYYTNQTRSSPQVKPSNRDGF